MKCDKCKEREGGHPSRNEELVLCDYCAEEYGCACGCFPPPELASYAWDNNLTLEKVTVVRSKHYVKTIPQHIQYEYGEIDAPQGLVTRGIIGAEIIPEKKEIVSWFEEEDEWQIVD